MHKCNFSPSQIYDLYSQNLEIIIKKYFPEKTELVVGKYLCPICMNLFTKDNLESKILTIEHIPPQSVGWRKKILTCKNCNNTQGGILDSHVPFVLNIKAFNRLIPGSNVDSKYDVNGIKLNGKTHIEIDGKINIRIDQERNNPKDLAELFIQSKDWKAIPEIQIKYKAGNIKNSMISCLRSAYLWGFYELGYAFIINPNFINIRSQILDPTLCIYFEKFIIQGKFPIDSEGIHIISYPKGLESYIVFMTLHLRDNYSENIGVLLPGAHRKGINNIHNSDEIIKQKISLRLIDINNLEILLDNKKSSMPVTYWSNRD